MILRYIEDIRCSLDNKCYFPALALTLTLPDICGMVEFPKKTVSERYINWCDKYISKHFKQDSEISEFNNPYLSGEIIYNLRNTFLHQGSPDVYGSKIKENVNQLDRFILVLGDGTLIWSASINLRIGDDLLNLRGIIVDITYLCNTICHYTLLYYEKNKDKFRFDFNVITQEEIKNSLIAKQNNKLDEQGSTKPIILTREQLIEKFVEKNLKEKKYIDKKKEIIQAVLDAKTKLQVNNNLMKYFISQEAGNIYQKFKPLIKDLLGK